MLNWCQPQCPPPHSATIPNGPYGETQELTPLAFNPTDMLYLPLVVHSMSGAMKVWSPWPTGNFEKPVSRAGSAQTHTSYDSI